MNWHLKRSLRKLGTSADPRPVFVRDLKREILDTVGQGAGASLAPLRVMGWRLPIAGITMLTMAISATGVYAYTSDAVLPDHPLYSVRQGMENLEESFAVTPAAKVAVQVKHLQRRLHEHEILVKAKKTVANEPMVGFETSVQKVTDEAEKLPEPARAKMGKAISKLEVKQKASLKKDEEASSTNDGLEMKQIEKQNQGHRSKEKSGKKD